MMRLIRWGPMAAADFVAEFFETDLLRAIVAARGIYGAALGPWSAGSRLLLLLRAAADPYPVGNSLTPAEAWAPSRMPWPPPQKKQAQKFAPTPKSRGS